jgi:hypothetical protein
MSHCLPAGDQIRDHLRIWCMLPLGAMIFQTSSSARLLPQEFRATLQTCELQEIHFQNCRFTWSNERVNPTLFKLDAFFCNMEWNLCFHTHVLHAISLSLLGHCSLLLADDSGPQRLRTFKFENFWTHIPGFEEVVSNAWNELAIHAEPCHILFHKLQRTGNSLSTWSRGLFSNTKVMLNAALLVILQLDITKESRDRALAWWTWP